MRWLPREYVARLERRVYLDRGSAYELAPRSSNKPPAQGSRVRASQSIDGGPIALDPRIIPHIMGDPLREGYIEILRKSDEGLIAVLELLSPTNKRGVGRGEYLVKRDELLHQPVHLVEVDLLMRGTRMPLRQSLPDGHYFAMISRADRRPDCEVYSWTIRDPLPVIPIPLETPDGDVAIDLQEVFNVTFERGPYDQLVKYHKPVGLPVAEDLQNWIDAQLAPR